MKILHQFLAELVLNIANLLKVKTIITLAIIFTFCHLTVTGVIGGSDFMIIAATIITYYFTKSDSSSERKGKP